MIGEDLPVDIIGDALHGGHLDLQVFYPISDVLTKDYRIIFIPLSQGRKSNGCLAFLTLIQYTVISMPYLNGGISND